MPYFPFLKILKQFNWLDIFVVILLFRICYIAMKNGLAIEIFKLLGTIFAVYIACHYYAAISDWIRQQIKDLVPARMPLDFLDYFCFTILVTARYLIFALLRSVFYSYIKFEAVPKLNKYGALLFSLARSVLFIGLIIFIMVITNISYLKSSVRDSYMGPRIFQIVPDVYRWTWEKVMSRFMTKETFNMTVEEVRETFLR